VKSSSLKKITLVIKRIIIFNIIKNVAKNCKNNNYAWYLFNINIDCNESNICEIKHKVLEKQSKKKKNSTSLNKDHKKDLQFLM
jgi:hypothetical protein